MSGSHDHSVRFWDLRAEKKAAIDFQKTWADEQEKLRIQGEIDEAVRLAREAAEKERTRAEAQERARLKALEDEERRLREAERLQKEAEALRLAQLAAATKAEAERLAAEAKARADAEAARLANLAKLDAASQVRNNRQAVAELQGYSGRIAAGGWFTLIMGEDGDIYSIGDDLCGQCGHGDPQQSEYVIPRKIVSLASKHVVQVAAGADHALFLLASGEAYACGSNEYLQLGVEGGQDIHLTEGGLEQQAITEPQIVAIPPEAGKLKRVSAGALHSLFLGRDGQVWSCGSNKHGQLGCGLEEPQIGQGGIHSLVKIPVKVDFKESGVNLASLRIRYIDCGPHSSAAIDEAGHVFTWGDTVEGQLGHPRPAEADPLFHHFSSVMRKWCQSKPCVLQAFEGKDIATISMGGSLRLTKAAGHLIAVSQGGQCCSAGFNRSGQLARETCFINYGSVSPRSPRNTSVASPEAIEAFDQQAVPTLVEGLPPRFIICSRQFMTVARDV